MWLTLSRMTTFRLFQTEKGCWGQFQTLWKRQIVLQMRRKHCGKRRNCSLQTISAFHTAFSTDQSWFGNEIRDEWTSTDYHNSLSMDPLTSVKSSQPPMTVCCADQWQITWFYEKVQYKKIEIWEGYFQDFIRDISHLCTKYLTLLVSVSFNVYFFQCQLFVPNKKFLDLYILRVDNFRSYKAMFGR